MLTRRDVLLMGGAASCGCCHGSTVFAQVFPNASEVKSNNVVCGIDPRYSADFDLETSRVMLQSGTEIDRYIGMEENALNLYFRNGKYRPSFAFYDDQDSPIGAKAIRSSDSRTKILLGFSLLTAEQIRSPRLWFNSIIGTLAHEWTHHLHYLRGLADETFNRETHADYMSGWYMGAKKGLGLEIDLEAFSQSLYLRGSPSQGNVFDPRDYGSPSQRITAMSEGFRFGLSQTKVSTTPDVYMAARHGYRFVRDLR